MSDEIQNRLATWVENSGRALELRVARNFRKHPAVQFAQQSIAYEDPISKQQREGDVVGAYRWLGRGLSASIEAAVECKAGKEHPWVAFYDGIERIPKPTSAWFLSGGEWGDAAREELGETWRGQGALMTNRIATHAVSAFGKDGNNSVRDATRQALSFARARAAQPRRYIGDPKEARPVIAVAAIVVTQAPLFDCELTDDGDVVLRPVERFDLMLDIARWERRRVYVRSEAALGDVVQALANIRNEVSASGGDGADPGSPDAPGGPSSGPTVSPDPR